MADNYMVDIGNEFVYLGLAVVFKNNVSVEIKRSTAFANSCYYGLNRQLRLLL